MEQGIFRLVVVLLLAVSFNFHLASIAATANKPESQVQESTEKGFYAVKIQHGRRRTITGKSRTYTIYIPQCRGALPGPPFPMAVMMHGFLMTGAQQSANAQYLAERGIVVFLPNLTRVLWGDKNRVRNVKDILDQMNWLIRQSNSSKSEFSGLIDSKRLAIAGNSSGGAVCLELLIQAQKEKRPIQAMCSMEGVPWDRSWSFVPKLSPTHILTLRAEPSICNEHDAILSCLRTLKFSFDDVKINGARHCDAENPTTLRCMCICGRSREKYRLMFQRLLYLYFRDALGAPSFEEKASFEQVVQGLQNDGAVVTSLGHVKSTTISGGGEEPQD